MRSGQEFQEDGTVDWQVATHADGPECSENANCGKVWTAGCNHSEYRCYSQSQVKSPSSTEDVASESPEDGTEEQTNVLGESEELRSVRIVLNLACEASSTSFNSSRKQVLEIVAGLLTRSVRMIRPRISPGRIIERLTNKSSLPVPWWDGIRS